MPIPPNARPNILFLMCDHGNAEALAPDSPCQVPNLEALAAEGVRFGRCHTTNAICSPARASLMTSLYPSSHGMWDCTHTQRPEWVDVPRERFEYVSTVLAEAGYHNGYFGKWHVEQSNDLARFGWHEHDHQAGKPREVTSTTEQVSVPKEGYRDYLLAGVDESGGTHPAYDHGIDFIRRAATGEQPWCCFVSTGEPHDPYVPPREFLERYDLDRIPLPESLADDCRDKPEVVRRMRSVWGDVTAAQWRRMRASYWATMTFLDHEIGRILQALRETGQYDNTIIVFTSDHGDMLGAHGLVAKGLGTAYEEVYNIPLIVRAPNLGAARVDADSHVSLVDLAPTLLDLCGLPALPAAQGRSLRPVLAGTADPADWADSYAEFFGQRFVYTQRLVWHGDWKYVFNPGGCDELYDLAADPHERRNLAADPAHQQTLQELCGRMWAKMDAIGDKSLFNTHYATLRLAPVGPQAAGSATA